MTKPRKQEITWSYLPVRNYPIRPDIRQAGQKLPYTAGYKAGGITAYRYLCPQVNESSAQSGGEEIPADFKNWVEQTRPKDTDRDFSAFECGDQSGYVRGAIAAYRHLSTNPPVVEGGLRLKEGEKVVLDKGFNNASVVILAKMGKHYSTVRDQNGDNWETMTCRLSPIGPSPDEIPPQATDHVHVALPSGAVANVSPDASPELLNALDRMCELAKRMPDKATEPSTGMRDEGKGWLEKHESLLFSIYTSGYANGAKEGDINEGFENARLTFNLKEK